MQTANTRTISFKHQIMIFGVMLVSLILFFTTDMGASGATELELRTKSIVLLGVYVFYVVMWLYITHKPYSIFFFFLLYSIMTNAGQLLIFALGVDFDDSVNFLLLNRSALVKAIDFQMLCTAMFCTFGILAWSRHNPKKDIKITPVRAMTEGISDWLYIIASLLFIANNVLRLSSRGDLSYGDAFVTDESSAISFFIKFFFYIALFVSLHKHKSSKDSFRKIIWFFALLAGLTAVLYGSRNVLIPLIFGVLFMVEEDIPKISKSKKILLFVVIVLVVMFLNAMSELRQLPLSELTPGVIFGTIFSQNPLEQLTTLVAEMGGSIRVLTHTITSIDRRIVASEQTFLYTLLKGVVPSSSILNILGITEPRNWRLSTWITNAFGTGASGWGYSMIAEAYYNFAEFGFLFFAFFGYVFEMAECFLKRLFNKGHIVIAAAWLYVLAYAIFLARAETLLITSPIRYSVYVTVIALFCRMAFKNVKFVFRKG